MVWLDEIVEGSKLIISAGQSHGRHSIEGFWNRPSTSSDVHREREDEDFDHAIALSLAEEEQNKGKAVDNKANLEDDEQLARALQESLNSKSAPRQNGRINQPFPNSFPPVRRCAGCNREIVYGRYLGAAGSLWHPECFRCHECNRPITDYEFSMHENNPYHKACHKKLYHPKCYVCTDFRDWLNTTDLSGGAALRGCSPAIPQIRDGRIEYQTHPFWEQKYCPIHERDDTPRCCSCERMEPRDAKYVTLDDGRKLCLECLNFSIMDTTECQPLYLEIQEFYEGLNMKVEQPIPLLLVERQALNEAMEGEKNGTHHLPETRGLCLSEEQIIRTVLRRPIMGPGNRLIDLITGPHRLVRRCEVTAILILYGLPRLLTGSILAHEMMHAWLRLKGYHSLDPKVEEGICQVLGHMWLDSEIISGADNSVASSSSSSPTRSSKKGAQTVTERKLGDFFKHQIESDSSPAYGDGFRAANRAVDQCGLRRTLDHIRLTGTFPH